MKILIDMGHPAHVHFFKNFIHYQNSRGNEIIITCTDKDVTKQLLDIYKLPYYCLGKLGKGIIAKAFGLIKTIVKLCIISINNKPDMFLGISPVRAAIVAVLMRKPCLAFDDTEHSTIEISLFRYLVKKILTPSCYKRNLGSKQIRYKGFHELAYLHPNYFKINSAVLDELGFKKTDKYAIVRFVSWGASHDVGQHGFSLDDKRKLVSELSKYVSVLITSESPTPKEFEKYRINISPEKIHDLLYYATLYIGEGGTMASESSILGTPAVYVSSLVGTMGNFIELENKYNLVYSFRNPEQAIQKAVELIQQTNLKEQWARKREKLLAEKIDVTKFMVDFIKNYVIHN